MHVNICESAWASEHLLVNCIVQQQQHMMFGRMQSPSQTLPQQQQGVQAMATQMMDSKMMDDDSDEEL